MIIDGNAIADSILEALAGERRRLPPDLALGIVMAGKDSVIESFVRIKERAAGRLNVALARETLSPGATTDDAIDAVKRLSLRAQGIIVQLPLSPDIDVEKVLAAVTRERDVDGINPLIAEEERPVRAPVAEAVREILARAGVEARGKRAVVVGEGRLVGKPAAHLLRELGAQVAVITETSGSLEALHDADIIVSGAGEPGIITPALVARGAVLIDAGTSGEGGRVRGDADPACADKASVFTPVPGGVGPIAVAMIFKNLFALAARA